MRGAVEGRGVDRRAVAREEMVRRTRGALCGFLAV